MKPDCRDALLLALEKGVANTGPQSGLTLFNASPVPGLNSEWKQQITCWQKNKAEILKLQNQGYAATHDFDSAADEIRNAAFLLSRNRLWNQQKITQVWNRLPLGGRLIIAGNKTDGIAPVRKWFSRLVDVSDSFSKYHAVVLWADKEEEQKLPEIDLSRSVDGYNLAEGLFSATGPDTGSKLLLEHFDQRIRGKVADLGAGWGYLSAELLKRSDRIDLLDLFESDHESLQHSEANVHPTNGTEIRFHWCDVTTEFPKTPYDWVIMNPPFHSGRAAEPGLGQRFIEVAASTLPKGGRLLMVANRNLPYERELAKHFRKIDKLAEVNGFKIIEAMR